MSDKSKARKQREVARFLRERDRRRLGELREGIKKARARRRAAIAAAVAWCREGRALVRERARARQLSALLVLRERTERERTEQRSACAARKAAARALTTAEVEAARQELGAERRELDIQAKRYAGKKQKARATAAERRAESDDEVRRNIPAELVGLFNKVRRGIRPSARMSRTEAFMKWAEENPEEVLAAQEWAAERDVGRLVKEYEAQERKMRSRKRYARSTEEISAELAKEEDEEVPF